MIHERVILDGDSIAIQINDTEGKTEGDHTYYPLIIRHEATGYAYETTCKSTQPTEVLTDPGFANEVEGFYAGLFDWKREFSKKTYTLHKRNEEQVFSFAHASADDCDTCRFLCSDQTDIDHAQVVAKLRAHIASEHLYGKDYR